MLASHVSHVSMTVAELSVLLADAYERGKRDGEQGIIETVRLATIIAKNAQSRLVVDTALLPTLPRASAPNDSPSPGYGAPRGSILLNFEHPDNFTAPTSATSATYTTPAIIGGNEGEEVYDPEQWNDMWDIGRYGERLREEER